MTDDALSSAEETAMTREQREKVSRRGFLGLAGVGGATLAVAGVGGLTWRAVEAGVFATGTGPAYAAWDQWNRPSRGMLRLVRAAVLAANAHNTQPWLFRIDAEHIDLYADTGRSIGSMDPLGRELYLSLGCALENLVLAGPASGLAATPALLPDPTQPAHIARVTLATTGATPSPLYAAIPARHTNRGGYDTRRSVDAPIREALSRLSDVETIRVVWLTADADKRAFADLTVRATAVIIADPQQAADDFAWYRTAWPQVQSTMDGITIDASGQPPLIRSAAKLLGTTRAQNDDGWLSATRDTQVATAFGVLVAPDPLDPVQRIQAGRIWQRMHLWATGRGLGMQPLNQVLERADRERSAALAPTFTDAAARLLPGGWHPLLAFRVGYPTAPALRSPRRPAEAVQLT